MLAFFRHFMGDLDDHDRAGTDAFAAECEAILFNDAGAPHARTTPDTVWLTASDAEAFTGAPWPGLPLFPLTTPPAGPAAAIAPYRQLLYGIRLPGASRE